MLVSKIMQVLKNLFGLNKKISASEIAFKDINNSVFTLDQYLINIGTYSTNEQVIGTWIDGKPIYRKVFNVGTITEQKTYITHGIANLGKLVNLYGFCNRSDNVQQPIPNNYTNWEIFLYDVSSIEITIKFSDNQWNRNPYNIVLIVEYTKTTD